MSSESEKYSWQNQGNTVQRIEIQFGKAGEGQGAGGQKEKGDASW